MSTPMTTHRPRHALVMIAGYLASQPDVISYDELQYLSRLIAEDQGESAHPIYIEAYAAALNPNCPNVSLKQSRTNTSIVEALQ